MTSFSWLHLTDFHQGMREQDRLWPNVKEKFLEDLKRLHGICRDPWDLVLFTGDLTYKGDKAEFETFDKFLDELWIFFREELKFSYLPKLLSVPGNHDLTRQDKKDVNVEYLNEWSPTTQNKFWHNQESDLRQVIKRAFANYEEWWERQPSERKPDKITPGILPGDFSFTLEKNDAKLGILGLNTSFLQIIDGDFKEKLALDILQFNQACCSSQGNPGPAWVKEHHTCLLLTHHPPEWLNQKSRQQFQDEIISNNFDVHLCGHVHEAAFQESAEAGTETQRIWQGRSLFGLEYFEKNGKKQRLHGYTIGKIELNSDKGKLFFWPRKTPEQRRQKRIIPDHENFELNDKQHTNPREFSLKRIHRNSDPPSKTKKDQKTVNIQYCQTLIQSISNLHIQVKDWKILHEELQFGSSHLTHTRIPIMYCIAINEIDRFYNTIMSSWSGCRDLIRKSVSCQAIRSEEVRIEINSLQRSFETVNNKLLDIDNIVGKWLTSKYVEEEQMNDFIYCLSQLEIEVNHLLAIVDRKLKAKIKLFETDIKQLSSSLLD